MIVYAVARHPIFDRELREQIEWWIVRNAAHAESILEALEVAVHRLSERPRIGRKIQIGGVWSDTMRSWPVGESGHLVHYEIDDDRMRIVLTRFRHEKQRPLKRQ